MPGVGIMISSAADAPPPIFGSSAWQTMPSSTSDSCVRTCDCWLDGKMSMMRLIVCDAEFVCSVPNVRWPVSAIRSAGFDRLEVAHLADQHDVRVLAQCRAQRQREALRVAVDLALVDQAALVLVDELDRILDREDVIVTLPVDLVDHRGERRRLPGPRRPVTSTRPRGRSASFARTGGRPSSSNS
jgi:hypothetical protein